MRCQYPVLAIVLLTASVLGGCGGGGDSDNPGGGRTAPDLAGVWAGNWQGADPALGPVTGFWQATVSQTATGVNGTGFLIGDVDCMDGAGHMNKKIKSAEHAKVPFMLILGGKEMETRTVTVRERGKEEQATVPFEQFVERVRSLVEKRALTL